MELNSFINLLIALIAITSTIVSYLIFRHAKDPEVVVYATPDEKRPSFIVLIIDNIGNSPAWDINFISTTQVPFRAFGGNSSQTSQVMKNGPLIHGIPYLGPNAKRILTLGNFEGIRQILGNEHVDITATYFSKPSLAFCKRKHLTISRIDIRSFECSNASDHNWDKKIADELAIMSSEIKRIRYVTENLQRTISEEE